jgi:hypothetical protein
MFKPIALPDQLLPLTLFGETHPSQSVGDALTALQLAQQHLPQVKPPLRRVKWSSPSSRDL